MAEGIGEETKPIPIDTAELLDILDMAPPGVGTEDDPNDDPALAGGLPAVDASTVPPAEDGDPEPVVQPTDEIPPVDEGEPTAPAVATGDVVPAVAAAAAVPDPNEAPLTEREKALLARLEQVSADRLGLGVAAQKAAAQDDTPAVEVPDFVGDQEIESIFESKESLNAFAALIYQKGAEVAVQHLMKHIPEMVSQRVERSRGIQDIVDDFYKENDDLKTLKRTVSNVANEIALEQPELGMDDLMKKAAIQTRVLLQLPARGKVIDTTQQPKPTGEKKPAFVNARNGRAQPPKTNRDEIGTEIDELIDF